MASSTKRSPAAMFSPLISSPISVSPALSAGRPRCPSTPPPEGWPCSSIIPPSTFPMAITSSPFRKASTRSESKRLTELHVAAANISLTCQIGSIFGQQNFNEEFYNRSREDAREVRLGEKFPVLVVPGLNFLSSGIDIVTSDSININNFGNRNGIGFGGLPARAVIRRAGPGLAGRRNQSRRRYPHSGSGLRYFCGERFGSPGLRQSHPDHGNCERDDGDNRSGQSAGAEERLRRAG